MTAMLDEGTDPAGLNVTDVVQRAGVSRPTFYKYFRDVPALVWEAALRRMQATFDRVPQAALGETWTVFARGTFLTLLTDLAEHRSFYLSALAINPAEVAADFIRYLAHRLLTSSPLGPIIHRRKGPDTAQQRAQFLAAGSVWLVQHWLVTSTDPLQEVEDMVDRLSALLLSSSGATEQEIAAVRAAAPAPPVTPAPSPARAPASPTPADHDPEDLD
ncbi:TetR/AcrR family transcriptional regulator [Citricoccus sp.]|uniref:TetR/AcrR family transcriptional regulator n=1 Tax=Citricoccus sp. TaxID=1978372 RepID=UPI002B855B6A|nr:TetR/AcrR family transcriptional regulator [Citricoccus sp.]HRO94858.1 TetR/AcrR family transcriptional regulator [Citricoccus sp.]